MPRCLLDPRHACSLLAKPSLFGVRALVLLFVLLIHLPAAAGTCGDEVLEPGEDCEAPFASCCEPSTCRFQVSGAVCRSAGSSSCDVEETCTGSSEQCPEDAVRPAGFVCRAGSGDVCDPDEVCSGVAGEACPANAVEPAETVCRPGSGDLCDPDELCSGVVGEACGPDLVASAGTTCRSGSGDLCDPNETCSGESGEACPEDVVAPTETVCRNGSGDLCDPNETCTGTPVEPCPDDEVEPTTTVCRAGGGDPNASGHVCDPDEHCPGTQGDGCPADVFAPSEQVCNAGSGTPHGGLECDPEESCPGVAGGVCPADTIVASGTICRQGAGWNPEDETCDASEICGGAADEPCPADHGASGNGVIVRANADARLMQTHRSSNDGAAGLIWLKASPHTRGLINFDLSCNAAVTPLLDCALLGLSIHEGLPSTTGTSFSAHRIDSNWAEGNQAFNDFSTSWGQLGPHPGSGIGSTWDCRIDTDLAEGGTSNCEEPDRWDGGDFCNGSPCYELPGAAATYTTDPFQDQLLWEVTPDVVGRDAPVSWLLKMTTDTVTDGSVKLYQRDGARFLAEQAPGTTGLPSFERAPRLVLFGPGVSAPRATLTSPVGGSHVSPALVSIDLVDGTAGAGARWENRTTDEWGYMGPGAGSDWSASIPLQLGSNEIEFTVYDACGTEGKATFVVPHAVDVRCGNSVIDAEEECDDGNEEDGDCCSSTCALEPDGALCQGDGLCTVGGHCSAGVCAGGTTHPFGCENDYTCYQVATTSKSEPFVPVAGLELTDLVGDRSFLARKIVNLCMPSAVETATIARHDAYRLDYLVAERNRRRPPETLTIKDRLGTITVKPGRAVGMMTPANMDLEGPASPPAPDIEDYHLCYKAKLIGDWPKGLRLVVEDEFEKRFLRILKPERICLAAGYGDDPVANPDAHLMCYRARAGDPSHERRLGTIRTNDVLGSMRLDSLREHELCLRASLLDPAP